MRANLAGLAIALLLLGGCQRANDPTIPETTFIETVVALRKAALEDASAYPARKQQILTEAGVTEDQLRAYIEAHRHDLGHMAAVWESINVRLADPATM